VLLVVTLALDLELTCADRAASLQQIGRARMSELEQVEDAAWGKLREALASCGPVPAQCERARADFDTDLSRARASIDERYRRMREEFEARCRLPVT
jgi:hypothetical protein